MKPMEQSKKLSATLIFGQQARCRTLFTSDTALVSLSGLAVINIGQPPRTYDEDKPNMLGRECRKYLIRAIFNSHLFMKGIAQISLDACWFYLN